MTWPISWPEHTGQLPFRFQVLVERASDEYLTAGERECVDRFRISQQCELEGIVIRILAPLFGQLTFDGCKHRPADAAHAFLSRRVGILASKLLHHFWPRLQAHHNFLLGIGHRHVFLSTGDWVFARRSAIVRDDGK